MKLPRLSHKTPLQASPQAGDSKAQRTLPPNSAKRLPHAEAKPVITTRPLKSHTGGTSPQWEPLLRKPANERSLLESYLVLPPATRMTLGLCMIGVAGLGLAWTTEARKKAVLEASAEVSTTQAAQMASATGG